MKAIDKIAGQPFYKKNLEAAKKTESTIFNVNHSYTVQASKSGRHIVSIKNTESEAADLYGNLSELTNRSNEIKKMIQQTALEGVINDQTNSSTRDHKEISKSLIQKKFNNLLSLQGKLRTQHSDMMKPKIFNQTDTFKEKYYSDSDLSMHAPSSDKTPKTRNLLKSDLQHVSHKKKIKNLMKNRLKEKLLSKSNQSLATNSSSHFPKFIKETVKLNVM